MAATCNVCKGSGKNSSEKCHACKGTGQREDLGYRRKTVCGYCKGSGKYCWLCCNTGVKKDDDWIDDGPCDCGGDTDKNCSACYGTGVFYGLSTCCFAELLVNGKCSKCGKLDRDAPSPVSLPDSLTYINKDMFKLANENENSAALYNFGIYALETESFEAAIEYFVKAVDQDNAYAYAYAYYALGVLCELDLGMDFDSKEERLDCAEGFFEKAQANGHPDGARAVKNGSGFKNIYDFRKTLKFLNVK
ncbi:MAG: hypothetical protein FWB95_06335 [Treponema sp.]|nr:hypothetical protein [Treponema sp.]